MQEQSPSAAAREGVRLPAPPLSAGEVEARLFGSELRPDPALFTYYVLSSLLAGPFFWAPLVYLYFRYHTMRYRFDAEGVSMRWGILFRREISLTYARIQDIHLSSNLVERWLGLARIQVQTASGSASAEMTIEGFRDFEAVRDFLYARMRGAREHPARRGPAVAVGVTGADEAGLPAAAPLEEVAGSLREAARELRALREALEAERGRPR